MTIRRLQMEFRLSAAVVHGKTVYLAGQVADDPSQDTEGQTADILRQIDRERETACDDWVVAKTGAARPYAASLAHLFELRRARRGEILASGIFGSRSRLGDRIEMLLRRGHFVARQRE